MSLAEGIVSIRPAEARDRAAWLGLWRGYCEFYGVSVTPEVTDVLWSRIVDPSSAIKALVAVLDDGRGPGLGTGSISEASLVGFANYVLHPYTWGTGLICYLEDLFVDGRARGRGAGGALIRDLRSRSETNGWARLYWHTHETNEVARSLYDRFTPVDPFVRYVLRFDPE